MRLGWGWCWLFDAVSSWILDISDTWRPMERGQYWDLVSSSLVVISGVSSWSQSHKAILNNFLNIWVFYLARGEATGSEAISKGGESWTQPLQVPNWKSAPEEKQYNNTIWISSTLRFPGYPCNNLGKIWTNKVYSSEKPRLDGDTIGGQSNQYLSWKSRWGLRTRVVLNTIMEFWSPGGFLFMITGLWKLYLFSHPYLLKWVAPCIYILFSSSYFLSDPSPIIIYPCQ